ncbi:MAG: hypothetical protein CM15mP4_0270 [Candidatus Neomarinimicrobiota bacterium]|nr:MAG: hypothetical protein CM15mP4_0270 [Candidatus Neomarinimicrobiota bacterium]
MDNPNFKKLLFLVKYRFSPFEKDGLNGKNKIYFSLFVRTPKLNSLLKKLLIIQKNYRKEKKLKKISWENRF